MTKYFFCYNSDLGRYLKSKGFNYVTRAKHYKSNKEFSLFELNEEIEKHINNFNKSNQSQLNK